MTRLTLIIATASGISLLCVTSREARAQELTVGAYGSVDYEAIHRTIPGGSAENENGFSIPTLDLFLRGTAGKWSFLSEVLFDIDGGNEISVDLDRLQVGYEYAEWLRITGGRIHTSLGFYNTAFPQGGAISLLPMDRPEVSINTTTPRSSPPRPSASTSTAASPSRASASPTMWTSPTAAACRPTIWPTAATPTTRRCST